MIRPKAFFWIAALALLTGPADAQRASGLSADLPDTRTLAIQDKVDDLFDAGKFERAFFIYRHELVPLGDKYAQYMVGYMHLTGMGVEENVIEAAAWYRLAAERDIPEFVAVRDQLLRNMDDEDIQRSDIVYRNLRHKFCDLAVVMASIKKNLRKLTPRTGSRLQSDSGLVTIIDMRGDRRSRSGIDYDGRIRNQLRDRVQLLLEMGDFSELGDDPDRIDLDDLERLVKEQIELVSN